MPSRPAILFPPPRHLQYRTPDPISEVITTKRTISIIFNDETRLARTDIFLLILLDEMNRVGFQDRRISAIIFDGTHCLMPR
jgi:nickel-dependent lactate racemase